MNFSRYIGATPTIIIAPIGVDCKDVAVGMLGGIVGKEDSKICFTWPRAVVFLLSAKVADI